jgi:hypothetical protein
MLGWCLVLLLLFTGVLLLGNMTRFNASGSGGTPLYQPPSSSLSCTLQELQLPTTPSSKLDLVLKRFMELVGMAGMESVQLVTLDVTIEQDADDGGVLSRRPEEWESESERLQREHSERTSDLYQIMGLSPAERDDALRLARHQRQQLETEMIASLDHKRAYDEATHEASQATFRDVLPELSIWDKPAYVIRDAGVTVALALRCSCPVELPSDAPDKEFVDRIVTVELCAGDGRVWYESGFPLKGEAGDTLTEELVHMICKMARDHLQDDLKQRLGDTLNEAKLAALHDDAINVDETDDRNKPRPI